MPGIDLEPHGRPFIWALFLLIGEIAITLFFVAGTHEWIEPMLAFITGRHGWLPPLGQPLTTDFASFYAAGKLALAGTAELAYDQAAHQAAEWAATTPGVQYQFFFYPPVFMLLAAPLALMPYMVAFAVFESGTLLLYLAALRAILGLAGWRWLVPALAFPAVFWTLGLGQNAFLSAALFAVGTRLLDRRPGLAGLALGALVFKPHLGLLIPLALLAGRHFRAVAGAAVAAGGLILVSWLLFGTAAWTAFLAVFMGAHGTYENGRIELAGMITVFSAARLLGAPVAVAYAAQAVVGVAAAAGMAVLFWRRAPLPLRAASLLTATLLALPVLLLYDLMLLAVAGAWLLVDARERGLRLPERVALVAGFAMPLICRPIGLGLSIGVAPLAAAGVLAAAIWRSRGR